MQLQTALEDVHFSQPGIDATFPNGGMSVFESAYACRVGLMAAEDFPPVRVRCGRDGKYYTYDNRRLFIGKLAGEIPVEDGSSLNSEELENKLRGGGDGKHLRIRKACPECLSIFQSGGGTFTASLQAHIERAHFAPRCHLLLQHLRVNSVAPLRCAKHGGITKIRMSSCSNSQKCKRGACSIKYPCRKSIAALSCGCGKTLNLPSRPMELKLTERFLAWFQFYQDLQAQQAPAIAMGAAQVTQGV